MSPAPLHRIREIPYNYTSFSDREIVTRFLGVESWDWIEQLRSQRRTGQSARMLFEILGDIWVVRRNPYIQDDLLENRHRRKALVAALSHRLHQIELRAEGHALALQLIAKTQTAIHEFAQWFVQHKRLRRALLRELSRVTKARNIDFGGLARVSHVTDASDWRVEYPLAVLYPDDEDEIGPIVKAIARLGFTLIARGGGTGYTGAAVPLVEESVVLNLEKLDRINPVRLKALGEQTSEVATVHAQAGAITADVAGVAEAAGFVFAVDPTSMDASTIGGNVAMNAGGKKAVLWGTTLDNLLSWRMVVADGHRIQVERLQHNLGKIHEQAEVEFRVLHFDDQGQLEESRTELIRAPGASLRKLGLGKDVTDKFLAGIPGIQKEGCDGIITSAEFILHQFPRFIQTVCLEFFDADLRRAVPAIVETKNYLDQHPSVQLTGLEHLDERYLKAVRYATKAARSALPKMLLLVDVAADDETVLHDAVRHVIDAAIARGAEGFVAVSAEARRRFWADRARTAAIAKHTNAFKINEDVVIPLDKLGEYTEGIERINVECSLANKVETVVAVSGYLQEEQARWLNRPEFVHDAESRELIKKKFEHAKTFCEKVQKDWQLLLDKLDQPSNAKWGSILWQNKPTSTETWFLLFLRRSVRVSYRESVERPLKELFTGLIFDELRKELDQVHKRVRTGRVFVATHMHAGDGNVHTNIPVNSNDYAMLQTAERLVDRVMHLAKRLGGVISGEHGIGITKLRYLDQGALDAFHEYRKRVDPEQLFNRGKLMPQGGLERAYTPSLRLVQQEALILEASELGALNDSIRNCLRCGKCKPKCNTHIPRANLDYSPRNKILATGLIIEAFLYEEQTRRGISVRHFAEMNDIADHCTICHKCLNPCPVDIDFGDVSILMRNLLKQRKQRTFNPGTALSLMFLNITHPKWIRFWRWALIRVGYGVQRLMHRLLRPLSRRALAAPPATTGSTPIASQIVYFAAKPLPKITPKQPMRALLALEDSKYVPIVRDRDKVDENSPAVFYFPGCGSERLYSQIGLATLALLYHQGVYTVLPPGYLCCGYPQTAAGDAARGRKITTDNRVLFHRVANTLNYLDIKHVLVSCGTCMDQLLDYQFDRIFPGCRQLDIHEFLYERGVRLDGTQTTQYLYHDPCHSPMKTYAPTEVASALMGKAVTLSDRCCGEAGTFSVSRPDIAVQVRFRKQQELVSGIQSLIGKDQALQGEVKMLTACPSCQQGLSGYESTTGVKTDYIVVELAERLLGPQWQQDIIERIKGGGVERVLL